jgi:PhoPQ-activated pathogenicity-related protein
MKQVLKNCICRPRFWSAALLLAVVALTGCGAKSAPAQGAGTAVQAAPLHTPLDDYIARPEPAYKWEKTGEQDTIGVTTYDLRLTSQEWHGSTWTHHVQVFRPEKIKYPDYEMVVVSFGSGSMGETFVGQMAANATGATIVNVFNVPNQPLFGHQEDALIAYTFAQYLQSGDATWPLLFPMTKSVVKAMDAVQEFSKQQWQHPITKFVIGGASKRGWTSWLVAAVDPRVVGIIPTVYDNLNLQKQLPHQLAEWGDYSPMIRDYTKLGLQDQIHNPRGAELAAMVDPWTYRDRLTMPKLIMNATNDEYWTLDSFNLYKDDLKGPTDVYYTPNVGHMMAGKEAQVAANGAMWFARLAAGKTSPKIDLKVGPLNQDGTRRIDLLGVPQTARLWVARAKTRDFRQSHWQEITANAGNTEAGVHTFTVPQGANDTLYTALIGEVEIPGEPWPLRLSTPVTILGPQDK